MIIIALLGGCQRLMTFQSQSSKKIQLSLDTVEKRVLSILDPWLGLVLHRAPQQTHGTEPPTEFGGREVNAEHTTTRKRGKTETERLNEGKKCE